MFTVDGGVVPVAVVDVIVLVAVVAGAAEVTGAALGPVFAFSVEQAPKETISTSAAAPTATGCRLTTRDSITPEAALLRGTPIESRP